MLRKLKAIVNKYLKPHKTEDQQKPEEIKLTEGQQKPEVSILEELKERVDAILGITPGKDGSHAKFIIN